LYQRRAINQKPNQLVVSFGNDAHLQPNQTYKTITFVVCSHHQIV
jgi:hypothetical protein